MLNPYKAEAAITNTVAPALMFFCFMRMMKLQPDASNIPTVSSVLHRPIRWFVPVVLKKCLTIFKRVALYAE